MLEKQMKILKDCNNKMLEQHFENEDKDKEILFCVRNKSAEFISYRLEILNNRLAKRKNLYIYPEQVP